tara:strand:- start:495 stop:1181 length:687 start_codon:yes stop_codon:yes gene_type:complete
VKIEKFNNITLVNADYIDYLDLKTKYDFLFLDPPFDIYKDIQLPSFNSCVAFTNWQNRGFVTNQLGEPRIEMIWHFEDGRWVSHNMPRITHENILIYGDTGNADVGNKNSLHGSKIKKGTSSIGKSKLGKRVYEPKQRKQLNSVLCYPRNVSSDLGVWSKPTNLIFNILEFVGQNNVIDPFMGSGTAAIVSLKLDLNYIGIEKDKSHFDLSCKRIENFLNQKDFFLNY